jgi:peptidoglycan hydrolase FlgJ
MAIAPPSDIVMDVVNAADPARMQEAQERLQTASSTLAAARLTRDGKGFSTDVASLDQISTSGPDTGAKVSTRDSKTPETYRKFEAMVLQNFIQSMLPSDSSEIYGEGTAGNVWKGMMAEQLGNAIAKGGGIGIADRLMRGSTYDHARKPENHAAELGRINNIAASITDQQQRQIFEKLLPGGSTDNNSKATSNG